MDPRPAATSTATAAAASPRLGATKSAQPMAMPAFVARCLEEIGLEGRCGIPLGEVFAAVDDAGDRTYRRFAWRVLRAMAGEQLRFHYLLRSPPAAGRAGSSQGPALSSAWTTAGDPTIPSTTPIASSSSSSGTKRRRLWPTTLIHGLDEGHAALGGRRSPSPSPSSSPTRHRRRRRPRPRSQEEAEAPCGDASETTLGATANGEATLRQEEEDADDADATITVAGEDLSPRRSQSRSRRQSCSPSRSSQSLGRSSQSHSRSQGRSQDPSSCVTSRSPTQLAPTMATDAGIVKDERAQGSRGSTWDHRWSPRGFELGEEVDVEGLSFEDATSGTDEGVLGVVACAELRLKYLGVVDPATIDTTSPQFDLLEVIGRARERGANASHLASSGRFGEARKLHYLLDLLLASNFVVKNIVTADQKRFNIIHLTRFANHFHPSMVSPTATLERDGFPRDQLPHMIARILNARGERACVFADIGRELGYGKRHQEKLRKYFFHQMQADPSFPLEFFMARCNTNVDSKGRKLWCVRLRSHPQTHNESDDSIPGSTLRSGPVIERGIMEQIFSSIQDRQEEGATIPEIRDHLGVPTFKLPYKLAQGLISNYNLSVEQVVLGKSTMYRMFAPGVTRVDTVDPEDNGIAPVSDDGEHERQKTLAEVASTILNEHSALCQPNTMKEATRGLVVGSTVERRRQYIVERVNKEHIVSIHQLRSGLVELERPPGRPNTDLGQIDVRSVRRILEDLVAVKTIVTMDITLPPKRVLQKSHRVVKCVALPSHQQDRKAIRAFIDGYLEDQQKKLEDTLTRENDAFIVVSSRGNRKRSGVAVNDKRMEDSSKEIVKYSATSYKAARVQLAKLHKQGRRLGMFFGIMYRCKSFHLTMWDRIRDVERRQREAVNDLRSMDNFSSSRGSVSEEQATSHHVVFTLKEMLDLLSVREYIQLVGVNDLLTEGEENKVRMAIARGDSWEALSTTVQEKIRACEADRFSRILRVLLELDLLEIANESSYDLLNVMRSSENFDQVISQVAFATLSGGQFRLKERVRITIKRGNKVLKQLPTKNSYVYAAGFSAKGRSEQFTGKIPLEFLVHNSDDAKEYWKALKFLSLEGARLGAGAQDASSLSISIDGELVRPAPLRDHNMFVLKVWVPRATANQSAKSERAKAVADVAVAGGLTKRKRFSSSLTTLSGGRAEKVQRRTYNNMFSSVYRDVEEKESSGGLSTASRWRKQDSYGGARTSTRAAKWSSEDDVALIDLYIEKLSCQWFIDVPLALQRHDERVAFRTTQLTRTKISWKSIAQKLGRKREDCILRVKELLSVPAVQARVQKAKEAITRVKNPSGIFHEEHAVISQPRLTALLCRALQIIFHERSSYYSILADMLISQWRESEVKLVWRYLWLAGVITRTTKANEGKNQKQRGFCIHSQVYEMKSLRIPQYSIDFFCGAAEYFSFVQQNIKEIEMLEDGSDMDTEYNGELQDASRGSFEQEITSNSNPGQVAVDLASIVNDQVVYRPEYVPPNHHDRDDSSATSDGRRSIPLKGLAGHLSKQYDGAMPEDFLKEYWVIKASYQAQRDETFGVKGGGEAFSTATPMLPQHGGQSHVSQRKIVSSYLLSAIEESGEEGISLDDLVLRYRDYCTVEPTTLSLSDIIKDPSFNAALSGLVNKGLIFEVNGYTSIRFVAAGFASMWTLNPYRIANDSTKEKVHFVFDRDRSVLSRPWLHLDGTVNSRVALVLKRRVVNIVMCSPGIDYQSVHHKMHRVLSLQDTRSLLEDLVKDDVLYARVAVDGRTKATSVFEAARAQPTIPTLSVFSPGHYRQIESSCDILHYFPSVNCVELLGALACDVDLGSNE